MGPLEIIGIIVAVEGLFKALDYFIGKITANYAKEKRIEANSESLSEYIERSEKKFEELDQKIESTQNNSVDALKNLEKTITSTLDQHREEYMDEIKNVNKALSNVDVSIINMKGLYEKTVDVVNLKIDALEKATNKHNSVIERTYELEGLTKLHTQSIEQIVKKLESM